MQLDGKAVGRHADVGPEDGDDVGVSREPGSRVRGVTGRDDDCDALRGVPVAASVARRMPAEGFRDACGQHERLVQAHRSRRLRTLAVEGGADRRLGSRPDAGHLSQPPGRGCLAQLLGGVDPERRADLSAPAGAEAEQAAEGSQLGRSLPAKLLHLVELPGLDELAESCLDPGPDPA